MDGILRYLLMTCLAAVGTGALAAPAAAREVFVVSGRENADTPDIARVEAYWQERGTPARRVAAGALDGAPAGAEGSGEAGRLVYYSGPIGRDDRGLVLADRSGPVALAVPVESLLAGKGDRGPTTLVINHCGTNMNISPRDFGFAGDWIVAYPVSSNCEAETVADRALSALSGPGTGWVGALQAAGMMVARPLAEGSPPPTGAPALQAVRNDSIVITTLRPNAGASPRIAGLAPGASGTTGPSAANPDDATASPRILPQTTPPSAATAATAAPLVEAGGDRLVQPLRAGLPQPSIIVGEQARQAAEQPERPPRDAMGVAYPLRADMRRDDAAGFARLLDLGAFDPDSDRIAAAIQTELRRMSCYGATVDGIWGRGSVSAVERYFTAARQTAPASTPEIALYRAIISGPDLTCPAPAPAAAAVRNPPAQAGSARGGNRPQADRRQGGGQTGSGRRPAATQPATQNPPATTGRRRIDPSFGGSGLFR